MRSTDRSSRVLASVKLTSLRGPLVLGALCAVPLVLCARSAPLDARFTGEFASLTSTAVLFAFAGTSAFALNLVLGARLRLLEGLFGGLDRMYRAHRVTGQVAFALLLGHVVFILAGRATISAGTALDLLGPGAGWTVFAGVIAFGAMTVSIVTTLFVRLGHEVFVYVQRSFGFIFLAATMEPLGGPLAFTPGQFVFVNFRSIALSEDLHPFELSVEHQVFSIRAGEVSNQFHPFSITSAPGEPTLRMTVKAVGDYTRALRRLEAGADAIVEGPYGAFSHRNVPNDRQIWTAGGIGVTPFLSMARSLGNGDGPSVDLYYCVEHEEEAHFLGELRAIASRRNDFRVVAVPRDRNGFLTAKRLADEHGDLSSADVLICGPPATIDTLRSQLTAHGIPEEQIHAEEFSFAKLGWKAAGQT
jgi:predicted ferric reductase